MLKLQFTIWAPADLRHSSDASYANCQMKAFYNYAPPPPFYTFKGVGVHQGLKQVAIHVSSIETCTFNMLFGGSREPQVVKAGP